MSDPAESKPNPLALIARALEDYDKSGGYPWPVPGNGDALAADIRQILTEHGEGE